MFLFLICAVTHLNDKSFHQTVMSDSKNPWMLMFGEKDNEESTRVFREFEDAAEEGDGFARFGYIDNKLAPAIIKQLQITEFPIVLFFYGNKREVYSGPRTARGMVYYIASHFGDGVEEAQEWWPEKKDKNVVILFTKSFKPSLMICAAQGVFKNKGITFAYTRDIDVIDAFGNPSIPSYWFYKKGDKMKYKGPSNISSFIKEISKYYDIFLNTEL
jgi:hypothetical protein